MTTIFSKIVTREIPANIVYEDEVVLAFLDVKPINPGHVLIIPKKPSVDGTETEPEILGHMIKVAQKVAHAQKKVLGCTGVNYIMNNGADAGQEIFHTHLHVVPRHPQDNKFKPVAHGEYEESEAEKISKQLRLALT